MLIIPKYIIDELAGKRRVDVALYYVGIYAGVVIFYNIATLLINRFNAVLAIKTGHLVDMEICKKWLYMDYGNLENGHTKDLARRCISQVDPQSFFGTTILGLVQNAIQLVGYTYIIISIHPVITLFILIVVGFNALIGRNLNKINYEYNEISAPLSRRCNYIFSNMVSFEVAKEVRINGASSWLGNKYDAETQVYLKEFIKKQRRTFCLSLSLMVIEFVQTIVIYGYCAYLAINGDITVGSFTVFLGAVTAFSGSFSGFIRSISGFVLLSKHVDDFKEFLRLAKHEGEEKETIESDYFVDRKFDIEFVNVSFRYPNTDRYVLKNVNIKIKAGERLSVVGYNGSGKSTFIKLLCRLYDPTEGKILVGGVDISSIKPHDYRELLSVVFQDYELFSMTIRDNVILNREIDDNRLHVALEMSDIGERIAMLADGVDTELFRAFDYDGSEFSGGEGQKLACARAYYKDAPIVILDEPTASLDPLSEVRLYERFNSIIQDKTSIYISHRLASVKFCDTIACFVDGELVERGTHRELIDKNGVYADMFFKQRHYYVTDVPQRGELQS